MNRFGCSLIRIRGAGFCLKEAESVIKTALIVQILFRADWGANHCDAPLEAHHARYCFV